MPPAKTWPEDQGWNFAAMFGQKEPDMVINSYAFTMKAQQQDAWDKRITETGITEPRWVRAIEIRPKTAKGRRITHHAIAYLEQEEPGAQASFGLPTPFMEWAVGKQGEMMRPDTGKLLLPGSKFHWDIHYSQAGEEITSEVELGIYFYPKGQEPKFRTTLQLVPAALGIMDVRPNAITVSQSFTVLRESARIESFQAHMHLRGKAMMMEAILPDRPDAGPQPRQRLQLQLAQHLRLRRRRRAAAAEGHHPEGHRVDRQHLGQGEQPGSESVGRLGRPHGGRDGSRLGEHHLHEGRRLQGRSREAQDDGVADDAATTAVDERFAVAN